MAARKRSTRSPRRSSRRRSGGGSSAPLLALGAILGLGAFSIWATANHKSPQEALATLFQRPASQIATSIPARTESTPAPDKPIVTSSAPKPQTAVISPVPRPSVPVAPAPRTLAEVLSQPAKPQPKPVPSQTVASVASAPRVIPPVAMPPRGVNTPAHSPLAVFAKEKLIIHKTAWDKSPAIATVEKGREMRSYGKTGRWHRVIVPTTSLIGWVHEDQLIGGKNKPDSASLITGSVAQNKPAANRSPATPRIMPPKAVGEKN